MITARWRSALLCCVASIFGLAVYGQTLPKLPPTTVNTTRVIEPTSGETRAAILAEVVAFRRMALDNYLRIEVCNAVAVGADTIAIRKIVKDKHEGIQFLSSESNTCLLGPVGDKYTKIDSINVGRSRASVYARVRRGHVQYAELTVLTRGSDPLLWYVISFTVDKVLMVH